MSTISQKGQAMKTKEAVALFDEMYSHRTLRDSYAFTLSFDEMHDHRLSEKAKSAFTQREFEENAASNRACMALVRAGYVACRDSRNHDIPTLRYEGQVIALWHGFGNVQVFASACSRIDADAGATMRRWEEAHS